MSQIVIKNDLTGEILEGEFDYGYRYEEITTIKDYANGLIVYSRVRRAYLDGTEFLAICDLKYLTKYPATWRIWRAIRKFMRRIAK